MKEFGAILFDMDGTLVDSEHLHTLAWARTLESFGIGPLPPDWADPFIGGADSETCAKIAGIYSVPAGVTRLLAIKQEIFRRLVAEQGAALAMPGIAPPLRRLRAAGCPMAVGTNGVLANCRAVLEAAGILEYFSVLSTFDQVERGKPAPDIYLAAAARLRCPPERCIVVEDSETGTKSGKAAGSFVVGIASSRPPQNLDAADIVLPDSAAALEWVADRFAGRE